MKVLLVRLLFQTGECESIRIPVGQENDINLLDGNSRILRQGPFLVSFKPDLSKAFVPAGLKVATINVDDIPRLFIFQGAFLVSEYINFSENDVIDIHVLNESGKILSAFVKFA
jgi:hypothetical protein